MAVPFKKSVFWMVQKENLGTTRPTRVKSLPREISLFVREQSSPSLQPRIIFPFSLGSVSLLNPDIDWFWSSTESILVNCFRDENDSIQSYEHFVLPADVTITRQPRYIWQHRG